MTDSSFGIRGVSPFAGTPQNRRQFHDRGERSLAKHAGATERDDEVQEAGRESLPLDPGRLIDITV